MPNDFEFTGRRKAVRCDEGLGGAVRRSPFPGEGGILTTADTWRAYRVPHQQSAAMARNATHERCRPLEMMRDTAALARQETVRTRPRSRRNTGARDAEAATTSTAATPHQTTVVRCQASLSVAARENIAPEQAWQVGPPKEADQDVALAQVRVRRSHRDHQACRTHERSVHGTFPALRETTDFPAPPNDFEFTGRRRRSGAMRG